MISLMYFLIFQLVYLVVHDRSALPCLISRDRVRLQMHILLLLLGLLVLVDERSRCDRDIRLVRLGHPRRPLEKLRH
jgi:hypothetical protein